VSIGGKGSTVKGWTADHTAHRGARRPLSTPKALRTPIAGYRAVKAGLIPLRTTARARPSRSYADGVSLLDRITSHPTVCHGKPCIRGLRYPVDNILELLAGGMSVDEVLADYEDLERDDILASVEFVLTR
jgi:uncharacterized protein (DUF433 family)